MNFKKTASKRHTIHKKKASGDSKKSHATSKVRGKVKTRPLRKIRTPGLPTTVPLERIREVVDRVYGLSKE